MLVSRRVASTSGSTAQRGAVAGSVRSGVGDHDLQRAHRCAPRTANPPQPEPERRFSTPTLSVTSRPASTHLTSSSRARSRPQRLANRQLSIRGWTTGWPGGNVRSASTTIYQVFSRPRQDSNLRRTVWETDQVGAVGSPEVAFGLLSSEVRLVESRPEPRTPVPWMDTWMDNSTAVATRSHAVVERSAERSHLSWTSSAALGPRRWTAAVTDSASPAESSCRSALTRAHRAHGRRPPLRHR